MRSHKGWLVCGAGWQSGGHGRFCRRPSGNRQLVDSNGGNPDRFALSLVQDRLC